jgi:hypothetical protein
MRKVICEWLPIITPKVILFSPADFLPHQPLLSLSPSLSFSDASLHLSLSLLFLSQTTKTHAGGVDSGSSEIEMVGAFWGTRVMEIVKKHDSGGLVWKRIKLTSTRKANAKKRLLRVWQVLSLSHSLSLPNFF